MLHFGEKLFLKTDARAKGTPKAWRALALELATYSLHTCDWQTLRERVWLKPGNKSLVGKYRPSFRSRYATQADSGSTPLNPTTPWQGVIRSLADPGQRTQK